MLILDEPTSSLDAGEVAQLFRIMRQLRDEGIAILFVTHFLDQVYGIADRITVLRNGRLVGSTCTEELPQFSLVEKMIGQELDVLERLDEQQKQRLCRRRRCGPARGRRRCGSARGRHRAGPARRGRPVQPAHPRR
ncbi:hypothetical protein V2I01_34145 [Micromonospora sp. BRA006-A]|nr:hypothetical protein [Micromonospora sp. BRA006-A]